MKRRILAGLLSVLLCLGGAATALGAAPADGEAEASAAATVEGEAEAADASETLEGEAGPADASETLEGEAEDAGAPEASAEEAKEPQASDQGRDGSYILHLKNPETGEEIGVFDLGPLQFWGQDAVDLISDINKRLAEADPDELAANLLAINATLRSHEFAHLWDYEAFQNLVIEALASVLDFAKEDGELSVKILTTLGLSAQISEILVSCIQSSKVSGDDIRRIPPERIYEGLQEILDMLDALTGSDMFSSLLEVNEKLESEVGGTD